MAFRFSGFARATVVCSLVFVLISQQGLIAQSQVVRPSELKDAIEKAASSRQKNLDQVRSFFSRKPVKTVLSKASISSDRIDRAVSSMSADELAKLAQKTQKIQSDFAAGSLSNQELTYVVIALAAAVLVLVVVAAD
jgi:hypothetical protein